MPLGAGTQAHGCCAFWWGPIALPPFLMERWAQVPPLHRSSLCTLSLHTHASLGIAPRAQHGHTRAAATEPRFFYLQRGGPRARTGLRSSSIARMFSWVSAKSRGGGQRGEEKTGGEREGGGKQEEMRSHCQLGSCVCCLEAAANHSLQLK